MIGFLILLLVVLGLIAGLLVILGRVWGASPKLNHKSYWQILAQPDDQSQTHDASPHFRTDYRGHHLRLNYWSPDHKKRGRLYTCIRLDVHQPSLADDIAKNEISPATQAEVIEVLTSSTKLNGLRGAVKTARAGQTIEYQQPGLEKDTAYLQSVIELLCDVAEVYPVAVALAGEIGSVLQTVAANNEHPLQQVAVTLLYDIAERTTSQLGGSVSKLLCLRCYVSCAAHVVQLPGDEALTYYGCRVCGQSRELMVRPAKVIASLDNQTTTGHLQADQMLVVNWLIQRRLFDFDEVHILQASDEQTERFAVQVGNDLDPARQAGYKRMRCRISSNGKLSANTVRVLQRMFGEVSFGLPNRA